MTTFAPPPIRALAAYWVAHGGINSGIVGDASHVATGTSYHLGKSALALDAYSRQTTRDKAGLSEAASALDLGQTNKVELRKFSSWLVAQGQANAPGTSDIREIIYSPDGIEVHRWDRERGYASGTMTGPGQGDDSHLWHTHISFYRDSEFRDKLILFTPYYPAEENMTPHLKAEDWTLSGGIRRPVRSTPDRAGGTILGYIEPTDGIIRTIAEGTTLDGNNWRITRFEGVDGFLIRSDLVALVAGGDPATDAALTDFVNRTLPDCTDAINAAIAPKNTQIADLTAQLSVAKNALVAATAKISTALATARDLITKIS